MASFSALQRAENSSIRLKLTPEFTSLGFSALQRAENSSIQLMLGISVDEFHVSVLFSEPKIPQCAPERAPERPRLVFQCSSASRKFLNDRQRLIARVRHRVFQCSSASRKFLNYRAGDLCGRCRSVSVLFSEPKIPQFNLVLDIQRY